MNVDAPPGASAQMWTVTSETGTHPWLISSVYVEYPIFKVGNYITHDLGNDMSPRDLVEYRINKLDAHRLKMTVQLVDRRKGL